jgi:hypothetical protein
VGSRWCAVVVDSTDPARLARWWAEVLDFRILAEDADHVMIGRDDSTPRLHFTSNGGGQHATTGLRLELTPDDRDAEVERLVNMGARNVDSGRSGSGWTMLADPEGNVFCVMGTATVGESA